MNEQAWMGVFGTSCKENEFRIPIHPSDFPLLDPAVGGRLLVEEGYGARFGVGETFLQAHTAGIAPRSELFERCGILLLPKPAEPDYARFRKGQVLWGWQHSVQGKAVTQAGIDRKMTFIAWEAMYEWPDGRTPGRHTFYRNNELAGYCSVLHALQLTGTTGHYGPPKRIAVISFGLTAHGAVRALQGAGYTDLTVFSRRPPHAIRDRMPGVRYRQYGRATPESDDAAVLETGGRVGQALALELGSYDIVVNCIRQDTDRPLMFVRSDQIAGLKPGALIIDVSCDTGMGFGFARPTSFAEPLIRLNDAVRYYAVDHTPSYLWASASYEISRALRPFIGTVLGGKEAWASDATIRRAVEIEDGVIRNPKILRFQRRSPDYPHPVTGAAGGGSGPGGEQP